MTKISLRTSSIAILALAALLAGCEPKAPEGGTPPEGAPPVATTPAAAAPSPEATPPVTASASPAADMTGPPVPDAAGNPTTGPKPFKSSGKTRKTSTGIEIDDMTVGNGPQPKPGQYVKVQYVGTLKDGTEFDSSYKHNEPFEFQLGGPVIPGWNEGVATMKVGGRSKMTIPYAQAYGEEGRPPVIPEKADLVFDIELLGVSDTPTMGGM